jgi:TatD DNase family protein
MTAEQFVRSSKAGEAVASQKPAKEKNAPSFPIDPEPLEVAVYDNHCHLEFEFDDELGVMPWQENLDRAQRVGVKGVVQVGVTLESSKWCAELATKDARVLAAVALHPNEAPLYKTRENLDAAIADIESLAKQPRVRAIGETGLDFFRTSL